MALSSRSYVGSYGLSDRLPRGIKTLLIANGAVFLVEWLGGERLSWLFTYLGLIPAAVVRRFFVWQLFTYLFVHAGFWHILWNMLALWLFGRELERLWGYRRFMRFYFFCGVGAGACVVLANYLFGNPYSVTVGASGAIYGVMLASAVLWPDQIILFNFLIPLKMRYYVIIIGLIAFFQSWNLNSGVSNIAHLTGMLWAWVFMKTPGIRGFNPMQIARARYRDWRMERAKKKFQVYLRKNRSDRDDPWLN
jgi:membrane associated rhomboid family serine protease